MVVPSQLAEEDLARTLADDHAKLQRLIAAIEQVVVGKREVVELTVVALLAGGHILFEDVPGVGKTTLARAVARSLGCQFKRIQFTSDMLPSDVLGISVYDSRPGRFEFKPGPIFANVVLADEINRTSPRTQSCLLEAMSEGRVTVDHETRPLPRPFIVMATQNPLEFHGTYPLPESQLDRFLLRIPIGYPPADVERTIVKHGGFQDSVEQLAPVMDVAEILQMQERVDLVHVAEPLLEYLMIIVEHTRRSPQLSLGASPRGAIFLYRAAQARAFLQGRPFCTPDDVKNLTIPTLSHRVVVRSQVDIFRHDREEASRVLQEIVDQVPVPG